MPDWIVSLPTGLPTSDSEAWDGAAAQQAVFAWAGGEDFDPDRAKRAFVFQDASEPTLRGSYKAPVARPVDGELTVIKGGVRAAKSRVPQADVPAEVRDRGVARLNGYWDKLTGGETSARDGPSLVAGTAPGGYQTLALNPAVGERFARFVPTLGPGEAGLEGYLVPYYTLADRGLYFVPGALKRAAKNNIGTAHHLLGHWQDQVLGYHSEAHEDDRGFRVVVRINEDTDLGREVMSNYRFGIPYGWSIGFDPLHDRSGTEADDALLDRSTVPSLAHVPINELRAITEAQWWESSTVPWGAIATAGPRVVQARSRPFALQGEPARLAEALRTGRLSPDQRRQLNAILTDWNLRAAPGPDHGTRTTQPATPDRSPEVARLFATQTALRLLELSDASPEGAAG